MKERIFKIMTKVGMTQQDFANELGISPASLSSIFNGRTNPTNNHVRAIHRRFPDISVNWLMFGEGEMYDSAEEEAGQSSPLPSAAPSPFLSNLADNDRGEANASSQGTDVPLLFEETPQQPVQLPQGGVPLGAAVPIIKEVVKYIDKPQRKITEIRIFFDDGTYETFQGGH